MGEGGEVPNGIVGSDSNKEIGKKDIKTLDPKTNERKMVMNNPERVGINIDHDFIVDARNYWPHDRYVHYLRERDGQVSESIQVLIDSGQSQQLLEERKLAESAKQEELLKYLASFQGQIRHLRVHPPGEMSPLTPSQAIESGTDGTYTVAISPEFVNQIKTIQEQVSDITLVVQFYDHRRGQEHASDVPETALQREQYIAVCESIIQSCGEGVQLEIGNETNVSRSTSPMFADKLQHASHVNPAEYADFYFDVARTLKERHPNLKLSLAGIACFDPSYLTEVLKEIERKKSEQGISAKLVDTISFHPYRKSPEEGAVEIKNGVFITNKLGYGEQLTEMQNIASRCSVNLTVGEINYSKADPEQQTKLEKSNQITSESGVVSMIYPGDHVE